MGLESGSFAAGFTQGMMAGAASGAANRLLNRGGKVDWAAIATDAFANEIGNAAVGAIAKPYLFCLR